MSSSGYPHNRCRQFEYNHLNAGIALSTNRSISDNKESRLEHYYLFFKKNIWTVADGSKFWVPSSSWRFCQGGIGGYPLVSVGSSKYSRNLCGVVRYGMQNAELRWISELLQLTCGGVDQIASNPPTRRRVEEINQNEPKVAKRRFLASHVHIGGTWLFFTW